MNDSQNITHHEQWLPDPFESYEQEQRYQHADVTKLTDVHIWAELHQATAALASFVLRRRPLYLLVCEGDGRQLSAAEWCRQRIARLRCEQQRRRRGRAA